MNKTLTIIILLVLTFFSDNGLYSQQFRVSAINASEFPELKVNIETLDKNGDIYQNLTSDDFIIRDGGIVQPSKVFLDCKDTSLQRPTLICLVLDQSLSMGEDNGKGTPWSWVTYAVEEFLNHVNMSNGSKVSIISFAFNSYIRCPFTDDREEILDSLNRVPIGGGTDYNLPFFDPLGRTVQNLFIAEDPYMEMRRLVIFLSDGQPSSEREVREDDIIELLKEYGIILYGIIIDDKIPNSLVNIASSTSSDKTKQMAFTARSKEDLRQIYKKISFDYDKLKICSLWWETDFRCQTSRTANITFVADETVNRPEMKSAELEYTAPIERVTLSDEEIDFGNPQQGNFVTSDLTVTAGYPYFKCTGYDILNQARFGVVDWDVDQAGNQTFSKFKLNEGESRTIRLIFKQTNYLDSHEGELWLYGIPCPAIVSLSGGKPKLEIVYPNGGEYLSKCDVIPIQWDGVKPNTEVKLFYGNNDSWQEITSSASDLLYNWLPEEEGSFKIRAETRSVSPASSDESDNDFSIDSTDISVSENPVRFDENIVDEEEVALFQDLICNNSNFDIEIFSIISSEPDEFYILNIEKTILSPGECTDVEIAFSPTDLGVRKAVLNINATCSAPIKLNASGKGVCAAKADTLITFKSLGVGKKDIIFVNPIFTNLNPFELKYFNMEIHGNDADQFRILSDIPAKVGKYGIVSAMIEFAPTSPGPKDAYIIYELPIFCDFELRTRIEADASPIDILINNIDFGLQRALISKDSLLIIQNDSEKSITIDSIKFISNDDNVFSFSENAPFEVAVGDEKEVIINFTPIEEKVYYGNITIFYNSLAERNIEIKGIGYEPVIEYNYECGDKIIIGESTTGILSVQNLSQRGPLEISKCELTNKNEYSWVNESLEGETFSPQEIRYYEVEFTPVRIGNRWGNIELIADTKITPDINDIFENYSIEQNCEALGIKYTENMKYGNVLACEEITKVIEIINFNGETPVTLYDFSIYGNDKNYFAIDYPANNTLQPGDTLYIKVTFTPDEDRKYEAKIDITNSIGYMIDIDLSAQAKYIELYSTMSNIDIVMHKTLNFDFPVVMKIPDVENVINSVNVLTEYAPKTLKYTTFKESDKDHDWAEYSIDNGSVEISGTGVFETPYEKEIFSAKFQVFLSDVSNTDINLQSIHDLCNSPKYFGSNIELSACFIEGRLIIPSDTEYSLVATPNPARDKIVIDYGIGLDAMTDIELYNSLGMAVRSISKEYTKAGTYSNELMIDGLSNGVYFIKMQSGSFIKTISIIINK